MAFSYVCIADVREPPDVSESDGQTQTREEELAMVSPLASVSAAFAGLHRVGGVAVATGLHLRLQARGLGLCLGISHGAARSETSYRVYYFLGAAAIS